LTRLYTVSKRILCIFLLACSGFLLCASFASNDPFCAGILEISPVKRATAYSGKQATQTFSPYSLEELKMFGAVLPPKDAFVQETYKGIRFLATPKSRYTKRQIALLKWFIDRTPPALLTPGPSAIITYGPGEVHFPPGSSVISVALASGPFVFFGSKSFHTNNTFSAGSLEGVFRAFEHELVHVLQFQRVAADIDRPKALYEFRKTDRQVIWNKAALDTRLFRSFMEATGWRMLDGSHIHRRLVRPDWSHEKTSSYGRSNILEDMAETVSFVIIGDLTPLSKKRVSWATRLLGYKSRESALRHTFPYSPLFKQVKLMGDSVARFDKSKIRLFQKRYSFIDLEHFVSDKKGSFEAIVNSLEEGFKDRGWKRISRKKIRLKQGQIKEIMEFEGKWKDVYVEVITYDFAKGYLLKPVGTIITVLSGLKKIHL